VLKANAYGHGAVKCALICQQHGIDYIGVACANEGAMLRDLGVTMPILVFGVCLGSDIDTAIERGLAQTVGSVVCAKDISATASRLNKVAEVHIEIDTGMAWIGFAPNDGGALGIKTIAQLPNMNITGAFSHLATSDWEDRTFANEQLAKFTSFCERLSQEGLHIQFRHISNSGGILDGVDRFGLSMARAGISLYGLPSNSTAQGAAKMAAMGFLPVLALKSKIACVRELNAEESVGYSRTYFTNKPTKIAVVSAGYADGYSRLLSNKGRVLINGEYANVVGNVCMDHFMVDITHIQNVKPNTDVVLIGEQNGNTITAEELAGHCGTINYEIVTGISERVPRVFI